MNFVVGLGNPGREYQKTRHNIGFRAVEQLALRLTHTVVLPQFQFRQKFFAEVWQTPSTILVKPQTYMNDSGKAVRAVIDFYDKTRLQHDSALDNLYVIHDDLDLVTGTYKLQLGKGPKIHNGVNSIYDHLHTKNFWHVRVGVDSRNGDRSIPAQQYVLSPFLLAERELIEEVLCDVSAELEKQLRTE